jgi:hypothetical protein
MLSTTLHQKLGKPISAILDNIEQLESIVEHPDQSMV